MAYSRRKLGGIMGSLGTRPSVRKPAAGPACESLEGRQLLAGNMGLGLGFPGMMGMGGPADVSGIGGGSGQPGGDRDHGAVGAASSPASPGTTDPAQTATPAATARGQVSQGGIGQGTMDTDAAGTGGMDRPGHIGGRSGGFGGGGGFGGPGSGDSGSMLPGRATGEVSGTNAEDPQLKADSEKLRADMQAIHDKSQVTPALMATVRDDLKAVKGAETKAADATALASLKADIGTARTNAGGPTAAQIAQVQADEDAVYKSQGVSAALIAELDTARQAVESATNLTDADRATIAADQAAVKADLDRIKASAPAAAATTPPAVVDSTSAAATSAPTVAATITPAATPTAINPVAPPPVAPTPPPAAAATTTAPPVAAVPPAQAATGLATARHPGHGAHGVSHAMPAGHRAAPGRANRGRRG